MIRIVLVDDQTLVRQGIRSLLELASDVTIVAEASDGDEAVAVIRRENPDVVLLDLRMPREGRRRGPERSAGVVHSSADHRPHDVRR